jgi:hypothetical protein
MVCASLNAGCHATDRVVAGFRATYVGFIHMQEYFKHLFDEINEYVSLSSV